MGRVHLIVRGRVQGVFFRASAQDEARLRHLTGWVRNRADGAVELVAEGSDEALAAFTAWCRRGPAGAQVDALEEIVERESGRFSDFQALDGL
ncbi:MAG: acylphosphatase [Candidatus Eremiobacter antarcticus]|nr:acylphosphatase [Candidatus Eremiobacteraeota bacterium]MBC5807370.1 acylphosphatase [Candidatus Eremiobacteraeota bacterium]PZR63194.1 MAG: acylphosphatase [Candidatus Eremiobacter sp. RRmetagenome_bin22]